MTTSSDGPARDPGTPSADAVPRMPHLPHLSHAAQRSPPGERWKLAAAWLVVGIPATWGVAQVVLKSMALFR